MGTTALWIGFNVAVLLLLALDLGVFHRRAHVESLRASIGWSAFWVALSLAFNAWIYYTQGHEAGLQFFTGYLIEKSLSVDNIFLFVILFKYFQVEPQYQHRVLFWGILGALAMRGIMIGVGMELIRHFEWILYLFGAFLIVAGVRMYFHEESSAAPERNPLVRAARKFVRVSDRCFGQHLFVRENAQWVTTPLFLALLVIESTDIAFAVDSIPAVFSVTRDPFIVYTSNVCAILGLRAFYFLLAGVLPYFRYLGRGLAGVLILVGGKMLTERWVHVPTEITLGGVAVVLGIAVIASVRASSRESKTSQRVSAGDNESEAELIARLSSRDGAEEARFHAARALYEIGRRRALPVLNRWRGESEFARLLSRTQKPFPVVYVELDSSPEPYPAVATVGIAVQPDTFDCIRAAAGGKPLSRVPPNQDAKEFELNLMGCGKSDERRAATVQLDILTTSDPSGNGAIAKYLAKFGEGIQQVEFDVTDVDRATQVLAEKLGQNAIYPETQSGADGTRVNFFLATGSDGKKILIELVEHAKRGDSEENSRVN